MSEIFEAKNKVIENFRKKYIDSFYVTLIISVSIVSIIELIISVIFGLGNGDLLNEMLLASSPIIVNYIIIATTGYLLKSKVKDVDKKSCILLSAFLLICMSYCIFTIRFDFLSIVFLCPIVTAIPFKKRRLVTTHIFSSIMLICYVVYQIYIPNLIPSAFTSKKSLYLSIGLVNLSIENGVFLISYCIQNLIHKILEESAEAVKNAKETRDKLNYDFLTDLFNENKLAKDAKTINYKSIAFIDVDDFKKINDTYLHAVGDKVLIKLAEVFSGNHAVLYRLHGDEFVILSHINKIELKKYLELKMAMFTQNCLTDFGFEATVSIGITDFNFEDGTSNIDKADVLLYESKKNGKNRIYLD